jgi:hypothetical protein
MYRLDGRYGTWNKKSISIMVVGTFVGWGFVTNTFAGWLSWQGYLLPLIGGKEGPWAYSNVGVVIALFIGFTGHILLSGRNIRAQDKVLG